MSTTVKAHLALLGTNLFFAANYTAVKYFTSNEYAGPFGLNIIRIGVSVILFWSLFVFKPDKSVIGKKDIWPIVLCAITAIALNQMLFIKGLSLTFPIHASLLVLLTPVMITVIAAFILKERLTIEKTIGLLLGVAGAILLIKNKEVTSPRDNIVLGDLMILMSAIAYTFYFILVKPLMQKYSPIMLMRIMFTIGFFMILPFCVKEFEAIKWQMFGVKEWLLIVLLTVPGTFIAYIFNAYGIQKLNASIAGAYIYSQPVFAVTISMLFLGERLTLHKILAAVLIFAGVYLSRRKENEETNEKVKSKK